MADGTELVAAGEDIIGVLKDGAVNEVLVIVLEDA